MRGVTYQIERVTEAGPSHPHTPAITCFCIKTRQRKIKKAVISRMKLRLRVRRAYTLNYMTLTFIYFFPCFLLVPFVAFPLQSPTRNFKKWKQKQTPLPHLMPLETPHISRKFLDHGLRNALVYYFQSKLHIGFCNDDK